MLTKNVTIMFIFFTVPIKCSEISFLSEIYLFMVYIDLYISLLYIIKIAVPIHAMYGKSQGIVTLK